MFESIGPLFFPLTPFDAADQVNLPVFREHLTRGLGYGPGGVFVACGTGEYHAIGLGEYTSLVATTSEVVRHAVPVVGGAGGSLPLAIEFGVAAREAGADTILLMPPYLVQGPTSGLIEYVRRFVDATGIPTIVYSRNNAPFDVAEMQVLVEIPEVVGFKDGIGDLPRMKRIVEAVRSSGRDDDTFEFFNGLPTAEMSAAEYREAGVSLYSSAAFAYVPEIARAFYDAFESEDEEGMSHLRDTFFAPFTALRDMLPGGAVSLVKAGARLRGLDVGGVRPPLTDPSDDLMQRLDDLVNATLADLSREVAR